MINISCFATGPPTSVFCSEQIVYITKNKIKYKSGVYRSTQCAIIGPPYGVQTKKAQTGIGGHWQ